MDASPRLLSYIITAPFRVGSYATVYRGVTPRGLPCAIKVFRSPDDSRQAAKAEISRLVIREIETLWGTNHPNLIRLLDFGQTLDPVEDFLALEWAPGEDFVTASRTASRQHFYAMLLQVCAGLDHLHSRGFIHGDLKPENVLVTPDPKSAMSPPIVKMLDFGFAVNPGAPAAVLQGSPHYLAPEVIAGDPSSFRSDLYSLGVILYECLAGVPPFTGSETGAVLAGHMHDRPAEIEGGSLRELHSIVYGLLAKDPALRPHSASALFRLIRDVSGDSHVELEGGPYWSAITSTCPMIAGEGFSDQCRQFLLSALSASTRARPRVILITGEMGAGRTRLLRSIALSARSLGFSTHTITTIPEDRITAILEGIVHRRSNFRAPEPILLALDDLTPDTFAVVETWILAQSTGTAPSLLVASMSTSTRAFGSLSLSEDGENGRQHRLHIHLEPLNSAGVLRFVRSLPAVEEATPEVVDSLLRESGGNPALLSLLLASLLDLRHLTIRQGTLTAGSCLRDLPIPASVQSHLEHLTNILTDSEKEIVVLLSLSSTSLTISDMASLSRMDSETLTRLTGWLLDRGLARAQNGPEPSYHVSSSLLSKHILLKATPEVRRVLHQRLAEWYAANSERGCSLEHAAEQYRLAGMRTHTTNYALLAATQAEERHDYRAAARLYDWVLDAQPPDLHTRAEALLGKSTALNRVGQMTDALSTLDSLVSLTNLPPLLLFSAQLLKSDVAHNIGDYRLMETAARAAMRVAGEDALATEIHKALFRLGSALCRQHRGPEGLPLLYRSLSRSRKARDYSTMIHALTDIAGWHWRNGAYRQAIKYQSRSFRLLLSQPTGPPPTWTLTHLAILQADIGSYSRARASYSLAENFAGRSLSQYFGATLRINIAETFRAQGRWKKALGFYRDSTEASRESGATVVAITAEANSANVLVKTGYYLPAVAFLKHGLRASGSLGSAEATSGQLTVWGWLLVHTGRTNLALRLTTHASHFADASHLNASILEIMTLRALSLFCNGSHEPARECLSNGLKEFEFRSPFDVRMTAHLASIQIDLGLGLSAEALEYRMEPILEKIRRKKLAWHTTWALILRGQARLSAGHDEKAESDLSEALRIARKNADRPNFWKASYWLGRVFEQRLQYERALGCFRVAALTVNELAMDLEDDRYRDPFLAQPEVREVVARHERLRNEVGKQVRHDIAAMSRSEKISRRMLNALNSIGQKLSSILDLDDLLRSLLDLSIENVRAERGMVFLRDEATGDMRLACARGMDRESLDGVSSFSRSVIKQVAEGHTLLKVDVGSDPALSSFKSLVIHEIKSILCVPMRTHGRTVGVIYLDTRKAAQLFTDKERTFVESFASQAAIAVENARLFGDMRSENTRLKRDITGRSRFEHLIGATPVMQKLCESVSGVLNSDCNVLIVGESGTGKELVAKAIHYNGPRQKKKFVAIDCGALPENLLEAELFGCVRGAFTGADRDRVGLIEEARGGTVFLDEITNTSPALQARLLRVLQEREVRRIGENMPRQVDIRVVAATNADIKALMQEGKFRSDLYYRLNVVTIEVPTLRSRRDDLPLLVDHFLKKYAGDPPVPKRLGSGVIEALQRYDWPGNVRELENVMQRLLVLTPGIVISLDSLPEGLRTAAGLAPRNANGDGNGHKTGEHVMIEDALRRFAGDKAKAARFIGWNRQKLYRKMKGYGIPADYGQGV
ncbi:MAG: hypothetical protein DMF52_03255 [Acidobacteria bacterium]|nr:MAG: hypothetical protein DMF52_03255 [Acidobacteriota bacterium]